MSASLRLPAAIACVFGDYRVAPLVKPLHIAFAALMGCMLVAAPVVPASASGPESEEPEPIVLAGAERILGHWQRGKGEAIIEITERRGVYSGVVVWSQKRPEIVGIEVFRELRYDPETGEWSGRAYSIKRDREVRIDIALPSRDELELTAHILIFTKDVEFKRVPSSKVASLRGKRGL
jgi:uncharacterized protein (DUF2147 family)